MCKGGHHCVTTVQLEALKPWSQLPALNGTISGQNEALTDELQGLKALSGLLLYLVSVSSKVTVITIYRTAHLSCAGWHHRGNYPFQLHRLKEKYSQPGSKSINSGKQVRESRQRTGKNHYTPHSVWEGKKKKVLIREASRRIPPESVSQTDVFQYLEADMQAGTNKEENIKRKPVQ